LSSASFLSRFGPTLFGVLPASLFVGLMFATAGVAVHPPLAFIATPLVCPGEVEVESRNYSYRPGQSGVTRNLYCLSATGGGKPAREDITFAAIGASFLVYTLIAFVLLQLLAWFLRPRLSALFRRKRAQALERAGLSATETGVDLQAILAQVAGAVERGEAKVTVRNMDFDMRDGDGPGGDDPAERLERLKALYDQGLITAAEYQAKRAEIVSGL
jgi:Short C-terminal domain